jgi:hypothetical protein
MPFDPIKRSPLFYKIVVLIYPPSISRQTFEPANCRPFSPTLNPSGSLGRLLSNRVRTKLHEKAVTVRNRPIWNGHRPPFGDVGMIESLQNRTASMCESGAATQPLEKRSPKINPTTYGLDVAKRVFQMYWVDAQTGEIANRRFERNDLIAFLAQRPADRVALEACGVLIGGRVRFGRWGTRSCCYMHDLFDHSCKRTRPTQRMLGRFGRLNSNPVCARLRRRQKISKQC